MSSDYRCGLPALPLRRRYVETCQFGGVWAVVVAEAEDLRGVSGKAGCKQIEHKQQQTLYVFESTLEVGVGSNFASL